ncbi:hypothetical protein KQI77_07365 [Clostridium sp. MSJ-8]|nr:hypothetical protein [Clostridium sp. MSJ-8]MBU5487983.1 hypothetical protein [Clostridium sp. MSJ-8]
MKVRKKNLLIYIYMKSKEYDIIKSAFGSECYIEKKIQGGINNYEI